MLSEEIIRFVYCVSEYSDVILSSLALAISFTMIHFNSKSDKKRKLSRRASSILTCIFLLVVVGVLYTNQYKELPNVVGLSKDNATQTLQELDFDVVPISSSGNNIANDAEVAKMSPLGDTILKKGTRVFLTFEVPNDNREISIEFSQTGYEPAGIQSIVIDTHDFFDDGYYYEDPTEHWFVSYSSGISGTFHYAQPLTDSEKSNWMHGGKLYDGDGNEVDGASFWSDASGYFAMEFPDYLPSGDYCYTFYHFINDIPYYAYIEFSI